MPYNSFMPNTYNPYVQQYQQMLQPQVQPQAQTQQSSGGLLWVQGIKGAKSHFVEPGRSVLLMDSESILHRLGKNATGSKYEQKNQ